MGSWNDDAEGSYRIKNTLFHFQKFIPENKISEIIYTCYWLHKCFTKLLIKQPKFNKNMPIWNGICALKMWMLLLLISYLYQIHRYFIPFIFYKCKLWSKPMKDIEGTAQPTSKIIAKSVFILFIWLFNVKFSTVCFIDITCYMKISLAVGQGSQLCKMFPCPSEIWHHTQPLMSHSP